MWQTAIDTTDERGRGRAIKQFDRTPLLLPVTPTLAWSIGQAPRAQCEPTKMGESGRNGVHLPPARGETASVGGLRRWPPSVASVISLRRGGRSRHFFGAHTAPFNQVAIFFVLTADRLVQVGAHVCRRRARQGVGPVQAERRAALRREQGQVRRGVKDATPMESRSPGP